MARLICTRCRSDACSDSCIRRHQGDYACHNTGCRLYDANTVVVDGKIWSEKEYEENQRRNRSSRYPPSSSRSEYPPSSSRSGNSSSSRSRRDSTSQPQSSSRTSNSHRESSSYEREPSRSSSRRECASHAREPSQSRSSRRDGNSYERSPPQIRTRSGSTSQGPDPYGRSSSGYPSGAGHPGYSGYSHGYSGSAPPPPRQKEEYSRPEDKDTGYAYAWTEEPDGTILDVGPGMDYYARQVKGKNARGRQ